MRVVRLWWVSLGIFAAVIGVVATLLGLIIGAANRIDQHAEAIWQVGKQIAGNTVHIWMLQKTNDQIGDIVDVAGEIGKTAGSIDQKLAALAGPANGKA